MKSPFNNPGGEERLNEPGLEERLNDLLLDYVEACEVGLDPDRESLLAQHPDLRDDLVAFFAARDEIERLAGPMRERGRLSFGSFSPNEASFSESELGQLGDFRLIREIGRGGMGIVYEAEQLTLRRRVALKVLPFASSLDPRQLQRFKNEAAAAAHLRHENIVAVHAVGSDRGVHFYAMQFVEGQSLAALIAQLRQLPKTKVETKLEAKSATPSSRSPTRPADTTAPQARLSTERSLSGAAHFDWIAGLGRQAALALEHAHQTGVIHRDVKPGNLLLDPTGQLWITDFGLAQIAGDSALTVTGELLGTLRYASPEQALGRRGLVDHRSDIYSLGATLFELLTLVPPFDGRERNELIRQIAEDPAPAPRSVQRAIPEALDTIVSKTLRKEPSERYATAQELAEDLQRFLDRRPILARPPGIAERFRSWARRHPAMSLAFTVATTLITVGSVVAAILLGAERERTRTEQRRAEEAFLGERKRAEEAEVRLALARRAVDELMRLSEEELADRPGMELLRKRVLRTALSFYQEFLIEPRDDPAGRAELVETTRRVERILADLAVCRFTTRFYLLCQPVVIDDLQLSATQRAQVNDLTTRVGVQWKESLRDIGLASSAERAARTLAQARINEKELLALLTSGQVARLEQIGLQSEGPAAFRDPEVATAIGLSPEQRERIRVIEDDAAFGWMRQAVRAPDAASSEWQLKKTRSLNERLLDVLDKEQANKWRERVGKPVKGVLIPFGAPVPIS